MCGAQLTVTRPEPVLSADRPATAMSFVKAIILCTAFSATDKIWPHGFVVTIPGIIDASTTNKFSVPRTRVSRSTTEAEVLVPMMAVPM